MTKQHILKTKPSKFGWYIRVQYRKSMDDLIIQQKNVETKYSKEETYIPSEQLDEFLDFIKKIDD